MYYVMITHHNKVTCYGAYSHEFAAYSKRARIKKQDPYKTVDIVKKN